MSSNDNGNIVDVADEAQEAVVGSGEKNGAEPSKDSKQGQEKDSEVPLSKGRLNLKTWLGKTFRVMITDGRVLVGTFNCTDKDANVVLTMCAEYLEEGTDARFLGNVMIPGKHIVSISVDLPTESEQKTEQEKVQTDT